VPSARSEFAEGKIATDSLVLQIFEMDFSVGKFAKIAQKIK
jgi:hypothetical protein